MKKNFKTIIILISLFTLYSCVGEDLSELKVDIKTNGITSNEKQNETNEEQNKIIPEGCVDLGLSVYWSNKNLGASKQEEAGKIYSIGSPLTEELQKNYDIVHTKYDTAVREWGEPWRMPTLSEIKELVDECTWTYETQNSVQGFKVTGANGNSIFLPKGSVTTKPFSDMGDICCVFWTGSSYSTYYVSGHYYYYMYVYLYDDDTIKKQVEKGTSSTYYGSSSYKDKFFIRPVQNK